MYNGWELPKLERLKLLSYIRPVYNDTFPQNIVYQFGTDELLAATSGEVVGSFDNKEGQQALIFSIDGNTLRPDGQILHVSWSRDYALMGRKPFHSKCPLMITDWQALDSPIRVKLVPQVYARVVPKNLTFTRLE
jgi:hypothetical protein